MPRDIAIAGVYITPFVGLAAGMTCTITLTSAKSSRFRMAGIFNGL